MRKDLISLKINGKKVKAKKGLTILELAGQLGIYLPTLCYCPEFPSSANCRLCLVEILGLKNPQPACTTKIQEGMEILTESGLVEDSRRLNLTLLYLDGHLGRCGSCLKKDNCDLLDLVSKYKIETSFLKPRYKNRSEIKLFNLIFDPSKCIQCRRCTMYSQHSMVTYFNSFS